MKTGKMELKGEMDESCFSRVIGGKKISLKQFEEQLEVRKSRQKTKTGKLSKHINH